MRQPAEQDAPQLGRITVAFLASMAAQIYVGQTLGPNSGDVIL